MAIKNIIKSFEVKKLKLQQKGNKRLVKKAKKLKSKVAKKRVYETNKGNIKSLKKEYNDLSGKTARMNKGIARRKKLSNKFKENLNKRSSMSSGDNTPYWLKSSNDSGSMFGSSSPPYWLQGEKKKEKKERGKSITIRL